ncbi:hypothetical protein BDZ94DRAFT_1312973 [Collybia nuda]|uniref:Uncharacterized protein n=1 Tax=Collybia nuda TaxID=64659 RepID=A0A9P5XXC8_9AGAR|nr:hypothetical protein BDZ94DRAFT_1312973 [Collybia nuda]
MKAASTTLNNVHSKHSSKHARLPSPNYEQLSSSRSDSWPPYSSKSELLSCSNPGPVRTRSNSTLTSPHLSHRHYLYGLPSAHLTTSSIGTAKNPMNFESNSLVSHLERPWWGWQPYTPNPLNKEEFVYHTEMALDVAQAAESSLEAAEHHLEQLDKEPGC